MSRALSSGAVALVVALVAALGGCGGEGAEAYCATLEDQAGELAAVLGPESSGGAGEDVGATVERGLEVFRTLEEDAPDDLADEWGVLVGAWAGLAEALETSGPESEEVREAADRLREIEVVQAAAGIEQHARDVCKTELGSTSPGP